MACRPGGWAKRFLTAERKYDFVGSDAVRADPPGRRGGRGGVDRTVITRIRALARGDEECRGVSSRETPCSVTRVGAAKLVLLSNPLSWG